RKTRQSVAAVLDRAQLVFGDQLLAVSLLKALHLMERNIALRLPSRQGHGVEFECIGEDVELAVERINVQREDAKMEADDFIARPFGTRLEGVVHERLPGRREVERGC